jgi:hypothetical protein
MAQQSQAARADPDGRGPDHAKCGHAPRLTPGDVVAVRRSMTHN